jgi:hypothetical protein
MELAILQFLNQQTATGEEICQVLEFEPEAFRLIAEKLWKNQLIQGELADGCCGAPCGSMCVSAMKTIRVWQLSAKGQLLLNSAVSTKRLSNQLNIQLLHSSN